MISDRLKPAFRPYKALDRVCQQGDKAGRRARSLERSFGRMSTQSFFSHAYQRSLGYLSLPSSTLNFVLTVSATPQQNSDLGCAWR